MLFAIFGTDHYRCQEKLKELKQGFIEKRDKSGFNLVELDAENMNIDGFKQEAMSAPFLSEKKMIIVKNSLRAKKTWEPIFEFIKEKGDKIENILVFIDFLINEKKAQPTGPFFNYLKKQQYLWEFNLLNPKQTEQWLGQYLASKGASIAPQALTLTVALVGNDLTQLALEADKLAAYADKNEITADDVNNLVKAKFDDNIFNLIDALGNKNKKLALKLLAGQIQNGAQPLALLGMISRQFKNLLLVKSYAEKSQGRIDNYAAAKDLGLHPFVFQKTLAQCRNFTAENLIEISDNLLHIESQLKSGAKNPELLLDLLIMKT